MANNLCVLGDGWALEGFKIKVSLEDIASKNEQERMKLRPDNISSMSEWKSFVKEKTSEKFKVSVLLY